MKDLKQSLQRRQFVDEDVVKKHSNSQANITGFKSESVDFIPSKFTNSSRVNEIPERNKQPKQLFPTRRSFEFQSERKKVSVPYKYVGVIFNLH